MLGIDLPTCSTEVLHVRGWLHPHMDIFVNMIVNNKPRQTSVNIKSVFDRYVENE